MHRYLFPVALFVGAVAIAASGMRTASSATTTTPPEISVTADGVVHAAPDTARLWIGVEASGTTLAPADREADQRITSVISALRAAGVADAHMRTAGITIAPQYDTQSGAPQQVRGYISGSMLELETTDLNGLPALLGAAIAAGANRVDQVQFQSQNLDQLRAQARDQAWQAARAQADDLAQRAGTRLDRVVSVDSLVVEDTTAINADRATAYSSGARTNPASVQTGELEVRARLHVVWSTP
jgi:uncharacterized protein